MFKVPEHARITGGTMGSTFREGRNGAFILVSATSHGWLLYVIASDGSVRLEGAPHPPWEGWEHASVHARAEHGRKTRLPSWPEMCQVKATFWEDEDVVMQLHPRASVYVNEHSHVLHLWRHQTQAIPEPAWALVGSELSGDVGLANPKRFG